MPIELSIRGDVHVGIKPKGANVFDGKHAHWRKKQVCECQAGTKDVEISTASEDLRAVKIIALILYRLYACTCFWRCQSQRTILASIDLGASSLGYPVRDRAIWHCSIISVASIVVLRSRQRSGLDVQKG